MTSITRPLISIVIPCYLENPEDNFVDQIITFCQKTGLHAELLLVIDPPHGNWPRLSENNPGGIKFIFNQKFQGRAASLKAGAREATGEWICFYTADLASPLGELITSLNYLTSDAELKFIFGERTLKKQNSISGAMSNFQKFIEGILTELAKAKNPALGSDPRCSFILFRRDQIDLIEKVRSRTKYFFTEIRTRAIAEKRNFLFHPIRWVYRKQTKTSELKEWYLGIFESNNL